MVKEKKNCIPFSHSKPQFSSILFKILFTKKKFTYSRVHHITYPIVKKKIYPGTKQLGILQITEMHDTLVHSWGP